MKLSLSLFLTFSTIFIFGQGKKLDSIKFCGKSIQIPTTCSAESENTIFCDDYFIFWTYPGKGMLSSYANIFINGTTAQLDSCIKQKIIVYIQGQEVTAVKIACKVSGKSTFQIVAYGLVNDQAVIFTLNLYEDPIDNDHLLPFVKKFISLKSN